MGVRWRTRCYLLADQIKSMDWRARNADLSAARSMGVDIIANFCNSYKSVADFERTTGIQLPEDIAAMLTPPEA